MNHISKFLSACILTGFAAQSLAADIPIGIYNLQQKSTGLFLDAYQSAANDMGAVTREKQDNKTQEWFIYKDGNDAYRILQLSTAHFLDSRPVDEENNRVVAVPYANSNSQRWRISSGSNHLITQASSDRKLDAFQTESEDFAAVTRAFQDNTTQQWVLQPSEKSKAFLKRFRKGAQCDRFGCGEFRLETYSNKERASAVTAAACNAGHADIELVIRIKRVGGWETFGRQTVKPDQCYRMSSVEQNVVFQRELEVRVNNPHGSVYHMMRSFDDSILQVGEAEEQGPSYFF